MSDNKEQKEQTETKEEEQIQKEPFSITIPDGESIMVDFEKHEKDQCVVMHAVRMLDNNQAKLIVRYKDVPEGVTEKDLETKEVDLVDKEDSVVFEVGEKEKEIEYTFVTDLDPVFEAQGSEIRVDGVFVQDPEEEDEYEYEYDEEDAKEGGEEEEEKKEEAKEEPKNE